MIKKKILMNNKKGNSTPIIANKGTNSGLMYTEMHDKKSKIAKIQFRMTPVL